MPSANAPKAPCVAVCESPQTTTVPGEGQPQLRSDDVDDALPAMPGTEARDPGVIAVAAQRLHLRGAHGVGTTHPVAVSGHVMVHRGHNQAGPAHRAALEPKSLERLRRGHLVDEVEIDVEQ